METAGDHQGFTFHYASTISNSENLPSVFHAPLHSTMLLLYQGRGKEGGAEKPTLHSTMLLLYRRIFQNVGEGMKPLHSTMLLLYLT